MKFFSSLFGRDTRNKEQIIMVHGQAYKKVKIKIVNIGQLENELANLKKTTSLLESTLDNEHRKRQQTECLNINLRHELLVKQRANNSMATQQLRLIERLKTVTLQNIRIVWLEKEIQTLKLENMELGKTLDTEIAYRKQIDKQSRKKVVNAINDNSAYQNKQMKRIEKTEYKQIADELPIFLGNDCPIAIRDFVVDEIRKRKQTEVLLERIQSGFLKTGQHKSDKGSQPDYKKMWQELFMEQQRLILANDSLNQECKDLRAHIR
jgi:hypothetical protein